MIYIHRYPFTIVVQLIDELHITMNERVWCSGRLVACMVLYFHFLLSCWELCSFCVPCLLSVDWLYTKYD